MTVANFSFGPQSFHLVVDTLMSEPVTARPVGFVDKFRIMPARNAVIFTTGVWIPDWLQCAGESDCRDVAELDEAAPPALRELWAAFWGDREPTHTMTAYHFGWVGQQIAGYAYRSTAGFVSEPFPASGSATKPALPEAGHLVRFPEDFIEAAVKQKAEDDAKPPADRVGIGGRLIGLSMYLVKGVPATLVRPVFEFAKVSERAETSDQARV